MRRLVHVRARTAAPGALYRRRMLPAPLLPAVPGLGPVQRPVFRVSMPNMHATHADDECGEGAEGD